MCETSQLKILTSKLTRKKIWLYGIQDTVEPNKLTSTEKSDSEKVTAKSDSVVGWTPLSRTP